MLQLGSHNYLLVFVHEWVSKWIKIWVWERKKVGKTDTSAYFYIYSFSIFAYINYIPNIRSITLKEEVSTFLLNIIYFFFIPQALYQTLSCVVHSPSRPSGDPGGGSHLSISRCCRSQLFWSNMRPGRHLWWRQMLLHKPAGSQCGFYNIKQTAFLSRCRVSLQRKPHCTGTRCDTAWAVGLALSMFVYAWAWVWMSATTTQSSTWHFHPSPTCPSAHCPLCCETKAASVKLDRSIMVEFKWLYSKQQILIHFVSGGKKNS